MDIQYLGHSAFRIEAAGKTVLIDPFFTGNPTCPPDTEKSITSVDYILLTHGHADHVGDTVALAKKHASTVVALPEICGWLAGQGADRSVSMNMGGTAKLGGIAVSMVNALHSSSFPDDNGVPVYLGVCVGLVIEAEGQSIYHAGDTDVFSDMALIQRIYRPNVGLIPIGGHYTMDARGAAIACNEFLELEVIVPIHYRTFPVLAESADEFKGLVKRGRVEALEPGGTLTL